MAGVLSDPLEPIYGIHSLRWAIAALLPLCAWACVHLWIASKHYIEEARSAE